MLALTIYHSQSIMGQSLPMYESVIGLRVCLHSAIHILH